MLKSENFKEIQREIAGIPVTLKTYQIGETWYCHISNVDPGATIARAEGSTLEEAEALALQKANSRLKRFDK